MIVVNILQAEAKGRDVFTMERVEIITITNDDGKYFILTRNQERIFNKHQATESAVEQYRIINRNKNVITLYDIRLSEYRNGEYLITDIKMAK